MAESFLGLDFKLIVAGCGGGLSIVYAIKKPEAWELIAGLVVGGFTANYLTPALTPLPGFSSIPVLSVAFFVGIGGKLLCKGCLDYWKSVTRIKRQ